jgi:hypothetical protein
VNCLPARHHQNAAIAARFHPSLWPKHNPAAGESQFFGNYISSAINKSNPNPKNPSHPHAIKNRMRTDRQKQASRASGAKSRGPVTPEGKLASSRNAMTHGMLSATIVLEDECEERFLGFLADLHDELQPQTTVETALVHSMAVARWRQIRLWATEKAGLQHEIHRQAETLDATHDPPTRSALAFRTLSDDSRSLDLIHRYDSHFDRQFLRAHRRLLELVDRRTPPAAAPPHQVAVPPGIAEPPAPLQDVPVTSSETAPQQQENVFTKRTREPLKRMQFPLLGTLLKKTKSQPANTSPVLSAFIRPDPWPNCLFQHPVSAAARFRTAACAIISSIALFTQAISAPVIPESLSTRRTFCQRSSE